MSWTMRRRLRFHVWGGEQPKYGRATRHVNTSPGSPLELDNTYNGGFLLRQATLQETVDVDRRVHPRRKGSTDYGGPFQSKRLTIDVEHVGMAASAAYTYNGKYNTRYMSAVGALSSTQTDPIITMDEARLASLWSFSYPAQPLSFYGPKAMARMDPTRDVVPDIGQLLGELWKDGLPSLPLKAFSRLKTLKASGNEYLNAQFGWAPLLRDITDLLKTYRKIRERVAQLKRDNNRLVRRSGVLYRNVSETARSNLDTNANIAFPGMAMLSSSGSDPDGPGPRVTWVVTEEKVWFAGRGRYVLPIDLQLSPDDSDIETYVKLLASSPSPSTVYELIPWSWLIDYFTNLGDIVRNAAGARIGTYTLDYCYLMRHVKKTRYYEISNIKRYVLQNPQTNIHKPAASKRNALISVVQETKERIAATPFGFGLNLTGLSPSQVAILTALGLSRQNFS